jgi:hypothetical protein
MSNPGWPFDQPAEAAAVSDASVVDDGAPVLLVIHYSEDHSWAFLSGDAFSPDRGKLLRMDEVCRLDATLSGIADLPPGWTAERVDPQAAWVRRADPDV